MDADSDGEPEAEVPLLPLTLGVLLVLGETLPARESDASPERVTDGTGLGEGVPRELSLAVLCSEAEREAEGDGEEDADAATEEVARNEWLAFALWETLSEPLCVTSREAVGATEAETDVDKEGEPEPLAPPLPLTLCVLLQLGETLAARESDASPERVTDGMGLGEGVPRELSLAVPWGETERVTEGDDDGDADAVIEAVTIGERLTVTL